MKLSKIKPNKRNPRKISAAQKAALKKSLNKFGDLGCIVRNVRTENLVSGHQRISALPPDAVTKIENKFESPNEVGTIAEGFILVGTERFKYREVDWDESTEVEAMLAANNQGGSNDQELLKIVLADFPKIDLSMAGIELEPIALSEPITTGVESEEDTYEESDEAYVRNTEQTTEQIETGNGVTQGNAFEEVKEQTEVVGKRYVIIIDCSSQAVKDALREVIKPQVEAHGGKFF